MTIQLSPELEALVQEDVSRGPYTTVEEFVTEAVTLLHHREEWLAAHQQEMREALEEGLAQAERGELLTEEQFRKEMADMRAEWMTGNPSSR